MPAGSTPPTTYDPEREPFGGIDPRVMGQAVNRETGEVAPHSHDVGGRPDHPSSTRRPVGGSNTATGPWPPKSAGPLPPRDNLPPDLNIGTALDEIDAWAHEHDWATTELARVRILLSGDPDEPDHQSLEGRLIIEKARARRTARASPTERGRRTAEDISVEVEEALELNGIAAEVRSWRMREEVLLARMFKAKDNMQRLYNYIKTLGPPPAHHA